MFTLFWENQAHIKSLYAECVEPVCRKFHLTRMELDILLFLANNPQFTTATEIVENRRLTKSHVSLAVNALVKKGYLVKYQSEHNHKTIHLSLCPSAGDIVHDGQDAQKLFGSIIFKGFTPEDHEQITRLFERLTRNIEHYFQEGL